MNRVHPPGGGPKQLDGSGARTPAPRQRRGAPGRVRTVFACCGFSLAAATLATLVWSTLAIDALHAQHGGAGGGAAALSVTPHGPADPPYGTAPGFWSLDTNHTFPVPGLLARARFATHGRGNRSCLDLAAAQEEPFSEAYAPRGAPPQVRRPGWGPHGRGLFITVPAGKLRASCASAVILRLSQCTPHAGMRHPHRSRCPATRRASRGAGRGAFRAACLSPSPSSCATATAATTALTCCATRCWAAASSPTRRAGVWVGAAASAQLLA